MVTGSGKRKVIQIPRSRTRKSV